MLKSYALGACGNYLRLDVKRLLQSSNYNVWLNFRKLLQIKFRIVCYVVLDASCAQTDRVKCADTDFQMLIAKSPKNARVFQLRH